MHNSSRSIDAIMEDWFGQMPVPGRVPFRERKDLLYVLFSEIKKEGHSREDWTPRHESTLIDLCVNKDYKNKAKLRVWTEIVKKEMIWAKGAVFAEPKEPVEVEEPVEAKPVKVKEFKDFEIDFDDEEKEFIESLKFQGTDEDLF